MSFKKTETEEKQYFEKKYNVFNSQSHRDLIRSFKKQYDGMNFMQILSFNGFSRVTKKYPLGVVDWNKIEEINELQERYNALKDLHEIDSYAEKMEKERMDSLLV